MDDDALQALAYQCELEQQEFEELNSLQKECNFEKEPYYESITRK